MDDYNKLLLAIELIGKEEKGEYKYYISSSSEILKENEVIMISEKGIFVSKYTEDIIISIISRKNI